MSEQQPEARFLIHRDVMMMLGAIIVQSATIAWWASGINSRVDELERKSNSVAAIVAPQSDRLTRVEVKLEVVQIGIEEIKRLVRRDP